MRAAGALDLGDYLSYQVQPDPRHPTIDAEGMAYQGLRFRVQTTLAGRPFGGPFGLDAAFSESMFGEPETLAGSGFLSFAGVLPGRFKVYPVTTHIAEKLHAYTLPRARTNTRIKDLPDLALLGLLGPLSGRGLRQAIHATFRQRGTHPVPSALPAPPTNWQAPYLRLARANGLRWSDLDQVTLAGQSFLDPVLAAEPGTWSPADWAWRDGTPASPQGA